MDTGKVNRTTFRFTDYERDLIEQIKRKHRWTATIVMSEALRLLAARELKNWKGRKP